MTIYKILKDAGITTAAGDQGRDRVPVVDTAYTSDALAQLIVDAWVSTDFGERLLRREVAKEELEKRGIFLENPVIIKEETYWRSEGYTQRDDNEVVLVLPDFGRVKTGAPQHSLLETARMLMACVPNGI